MKKRDVEFLEWIYDRMRYVHKENPDVDYMHKLKSLIKEQSPKKEKVK